MPTNNGYDGSGGQDKREFRSFWERVCVIKYYIDHLCKTDVVPYNLCIYLWNNLNMRDLDLKQAASFDKVIIFVNMIKNFITIEIANKVDKCKGCDRADIDCLYLIERCNDCKICEKCMTDSRTTLKCPICNRGLRPETKFAKFEIKNNFNDKLRRYKINMNRFFMDIVLNLCFDQSYLKLPDAEVIRAIILTLLPQRIDKKDENAIDLSLSPTIKSTLFQLLLNYSQTDVETHLDTIFSQSAENLQQSYNQGDLINLKLMYCNSIDDNLHVKFNESPQLYDCLLQSINEIGDCLATTVIAQKEINRLRCLAQIRFCLVTFVRLAVQADNDNIDNHLRKFGDSVRELIEGIDQRCPWLRLFLIKVLFKNHGQDGLNKVIQNRHFKWIVPTSYQSDQDEVIIQKST